MTAVNAPCDLPGVARAGTAVQDAYSTTSIKAA